MSGPEQGGTHDRWAQLRFAIVGHLLAAPPKRGDLRAELERLAEREWRHPIMDEPVRFGVSTIERWFYAALAERKDPVGVLRRRPRKDRGQRKSVSSALRALVRTQYEEHPGWSYQLHFDNLVVCVERDPTLGPLPSYATLRRYMKEQGLTQRRRRREPRTSGEAVAAWRIASLEVRSYEAEYVDGLWHLDFHELSRPVLTRNGEWHKPSLLAILDDHSRLSCHLQWYLSETVEALVHGFSQAIQKRGLPRELMSDNGAAMKAAEFREGLSNLGILHEPTLPYSPYQNGKQEVFFAAVEGRLVAMLENLPDLTLELLNEATLAWAELEYNRKVHSEIGVSPLERFLHHQSVGRDSPSSLELQQAFRACVSRKQRKSDGTIHLLGRRFEIPSRFRHLDRLQLRYARWDLSSVDLFDVQLRKVICPIYPLDKTRNADAKRRLMDEAGASSPSPASPTIAPLLQKLMADYAATGLPPAYLPKTEESS